MFFRAQKSHAGTVAGLAPGMEICFVELVRDALLPPTTLAASICISIRVGRITRPSAYSSRALLSAQYSREQTGQETLLDWRSSKHILHRLLSNLVGYGTYLLLLDTIP